MKKVLIIGGGFAGLAAGVALAEAGHCVELLERRPFLGGRAYSFLDANSGDVVDNGQHLMMGCYRETFSFLKKIGSLELVQFQERSRVDFLDLNGQATLDCPALPAPLHLLAGLIGLRGLTLGDKLRTLNLGSTLRLKNGKLQKKIGHLTVDEWLSACGQSQRIKDRFWDPLSIATLNEDPKVAPASLLVKVLQDGFGGTRQDSCMVISKVGLSDLYTAQAKAFIEARGGSVQIKTPVEKILVEKNQCLGIQLQSGETLQADGYISAMPYFALKKLLPDDIWETHADFGKWRDFRSAPIVSINLWFDRPITDLIFAGLLGTRIQWLFNKGMILKRSNHDKQHLSLIISAAHHFHKIPKEQLVEMAIEDLRTLLPQSREANVVHSLVVKEHDATFSSTLAVENSRPDPQTSVENFFLAGDWTNTGLPATIEGAVLSGHKCAALIK